MKELIYAMLGYEADPFDGFKDSEAIRNDAIVALLTGDFNRIKKIAETNNKEDFKK